MRKGRIAIKVGANRANVPPNILGVSYDVKMCVYLGPWGGGEAACRSKDLFFKY